MPDTTREPEPEQPFDHDAATRLEARIGARDLWGIEADLREVLRQLAWHKQTGEQLAEKCANWRGEYEQARARLEAVRSVVNEWCAYAEKRTQGHPEAAFAAGNALGQILRALDGDPEGV